MATAYTLDRNTRQAMRNAARVLEETAAALRALDRRALDQARELGRITDAEHAEGVANERGEVTRALNSAAALRVLAEPAPTISNDTATAAAAGDAIAQALGLARVRSGPFAGRYSLPGKDIATPAALARTVADIVAPHI